MKDQETSSYASDAIVGMTELATTDPMVPNESHPNYETEHNDPDVLAVQEQLDGRGLERFRVRRVNEQTIVIENPERPAEPGHDGVILDLDDVGFKYSESKPERGALFVEHAMTITGLPAEECKPILAATDSFARRDKYGMELYRFEDHVAMIAYALNAIQEEPQEERSSVAADVLKQIEAERLRAKSTSLPPPEADSPFYLENDVLHIANTETQAEEEQVLRNKVFANMMHPEMYDDVREALPLLARDRGTEFQLNIFGLTYGGFVFQGGKAADMLEEYGDCMSGIYITEGPKGDCVRAMADEHVFGETPEVYLVVDDDPKQQESIAKAEVDIQAQSGVDFFHLRPQRPNTKTYSRQWKEYDDQLWAGRNNRYAHDSATVPIPLFAHMYRALAQGRFNLDRGMLIDTHTGPISMRRMQYYAERYNSGIKSLVDSGKIHHDWKYPIIHDSILYGLDP